MSRHLRILSDANIVVSRRDGRQQVYRYWPGSMDPVADWKSDAHDPLLEKPRQVGGTSDEWWAHQDSNLERAGYEPAALTVELWAHDSLQSGVVSRKDYRLTTDSGLRSPPLEERAELAAARRVAQLAERLGLDLADALARDREALADFFERVLAAVADAEARGSKAHSHDEY